MCIQRSVQSVLVGSWSGLESTFRGKMVNWRSKRKRVMERTVATEAMGGEGVDCVNYGEGEK